MHCCLFGFDECFGACFDTTIAEEMDATVHLKNLCLIKKAAV